MQLGCYFVWGKRKGVCFSCYLGCSITGRVTECVFNRDQLDAKPNSMDAESFANLSCMCTTEFNPLLFFLSLLFFSHKPYGINVDGLRFYALYTHTLLNCSLSLILIQDIGVKITLLRSNII